ncbi:DNA polymerase III, beta subunit [Brevibacterium aurantiacum]|uniref:Beta sliding clamp n=1 Tax=Brevibacterium aurantiacum TaxID=273384 RepID=A0A2H1JLL3_BREAU|nr:DNA polymerase III subunit beta [Brevibacterium aurantiacum]SMX88178.1 DNA polymerase III, beta subunit [Brevibacterium aurantiacum]
MNAEASPLKFKVNRDVLADAVTWATKTLPSRPSAPVLTGILITAEAGGTVRLSVFDYEVSSRVEIAADVETAGTVLVSGRLLADISKALPNQEVTLEQIDSKVDVTCSSSRFSLMTMPVGEYPSLPQIPDASGTVAAGEFQNAVSQVTIATSKDDTLPILTSVRVEIEGEKVTLLATDRYRLAVREFTWNPGRPDVSAVALLRGRTLSDVSKSLGGDVTIGLSNDAGKDLISFTSAGRVTTSLLVEGEYPKVRSLFPDSVPIHAIVETGVLREAVRRVSLVAERNTPLRFEVSDGMLTLHAGTGDDAQASEAVEAVLQGDPITVGFNPHYIAEGLAAIESPYVNFSFTQPMKPVIISGQRDLESSADESYRYLLMPTRI